MNYSKTDLYKIILQNTDLSFHSVKSILNVPDHPKTLRDEVAIAALQAMLGNESKEDNHRGANGLKVFPKWAYEWADAMLEARK